MQINPQIFREYDIRGVVDKDLTPDVIRRLGQGFGTHMAKLGLKKLAVGRDGRLSSKAFSEALIQGLMSTGCDVVDIGYLSDTGLLFLSFPSEQRGRNDGHRKS